MLTNKYIINDTTQSHRLWVVTQDLNSPIRVSRFQQGIGYYYGFIESLNKVIMWITVVIN